jgi:hypothetical protein
MILTPCSDLKTRQIVWASRNSDSEPQTHNEFEVCTTTAAMIAGAHAQRYASDLKRVTL